MNSTLLMTNEIDYDPVKTLMRILRQMHFSGKIVPASYNAKKS